MSERLRGQFRACPFCAEEIRAEAIKCRFCGSNLAAGADGSASTAKPTAIAPARTAVAEFNSRRDLERWLAAAGTDVEVISTSTTKRWSLWSGFLGGAKSYTVTYRDHRPAGQDSGHQTFPWKTLLVLGALILVMWALSSAASPRTSTASYVSPPIAQTAAPARYRADQLIMPPDQFPIPTYVVRQDQGDTSGGWTRVFNPAGRDDAGIGVAIHVVPASSGPFTFFTVYANQKCSVAALASATGAAEATTFTPRLGDLDRACIYGFATGPAAFAYRTILDRYIVDVVVLGATGISTAEQIDRARTVVQTQLDIIRRLR